MCSIKLIILRNETYLYIFSIFAQYSNEPMKTIHLHFFLKKDRYYSMINYEFNDIYHFIY